MLLRKGAKIALIGATGGIGRAMLEYLSQNHNVSKIYALSRNPALSSLDKVQTLKLDFQDEDTVKNAANVIKADGGNLDLVFVATGLLHADGIKPEKSLKELDAAVLQHVFLVNVTGPMLVAKHFCPLLRRNEQSIFAALSARVGSIGDNRLGGWYAYRMSKAALNMGIKNLSIEVQRRNPRAVVVGIHPGTTDTGLSKPFQSNVPNGKLFTPEFSSGEILDVLFNLQPIDSGKCFDWAGKQIEA